MELISFVTYVYQVNGYQSNILSPHRGLRQDDPLSPYLFILAFNALSRLISSAQQQSLISGFKLARFAPSLTHIFFADDAILQYLKDRIFGKLEGRKGSLLNQAGKEVLIKSIIQAIPSYIMFILRLPKNFCKAITSAISNFWWRSNQRSKGIHWKKWETMCNSKSMGGLGFRNFHHLNSSLLSKQAWRMHLKPNAYWALTLKSIYCERADLWTVNSKTGDSWVWKRLLHGRDI